MKFLPLTVTIATVLIPLVHAFGVLPPPAIEHVVSSRLMIQQQQPVINPTLLQGIREWVIPSADAASTPSEKDVKLLQEAVGTFYDQAHDYAKAEGLLTQAIAAWKDQPADERAGLYRIRADCRMSLLKPQEAQQDYTDAITLLVSPEGDLADPAELPAAYLGRGRSIRAQGEGISKDQAKMAAKDYQMALRLSSREDWDTERENEEDGASRNPFAAWEWGAALRSAGDYNAAADIHALTSQSFDEIGDKARSVISLLDTGIDYACAGKTVEAKELLTKAIKKTNAIEGRDVALLQRVIAKEGEARMALGSILWESNEKGAAETQLDTAYTRLEQLDQSAQEYNAKKKQSAEPLPEKLKFSIDDQPGAFEMSSTRFKNENFLNHLGWSDSLKKKMSKFENLGR